MHYSKVKVKVSTAITSGQAEECMSFNITNQRFCFCLDKEVSQDLGLIVKNWEFYLQYPHISFLYIVHHPRSEDLCWFHHQPMNIIKLNTIGDAISIKSNP